MSIRERWNAWLDAPLRGPGTRNMLEHCGPYTGYAAGMAVGAVGMFSGNHVLQIVGVYVTSTSLLGGIDKALKRYRTR